MHTRKKAAPGTAAASNELEPLYDDGHAELPLWQGRTTSEPDPEGSDGKSRRDSALEMLESRRGELIEAGRRALLRHLLVHGAGTADDIRDALTLPDGVNPVCLGAVPVSLARAGIIHRVGYEPSRRPERHGAPTAVWAIADESAARQWLAEHGGKGVADE